MSLVFRTDNSPVVVAWQTEPSESETLPIDPSWPNGLRFAGAKLVLTSALKGGAVKTKRHILEALAAVLILALVLTLVILRSGTASGYPASATPTPGLPQPGNIKCAYR